MTIVAMMALIILMRSFQHGDDHDNKNDDNDDRMLIILPLDHGHGPGKRNPPELAELTLTFNLRKLFP